MLIAFYAPMKSPYAARPSGDRRIARLFVNALQQAGYKVEVASQLRCWNGNGDDKHQIRLREEAQQEAGKLIEHYRSASAEQRPVAWFTYHLYHKAPDWIGPEVAEALGIPYLVAEASVAGKQVDGPWAIGHQQVITALGQTSAVFSLNPTDNEGIVPYLPSTVRPITLPPFLEQRDPPSHNRHSAKQRLGANLKISPDRYWLLCVAMMREDSKLKSYQILADALDRIERTDWSMLIVGDGVAQTQIRELFRYENARQVYFLGRRNEEAIAGIMEASDLLVWPAVNEAIGMVALEAHASGLPVVWGRSGAIDAIVDDGDSGILVDNPLAQGISDAVGSLLDNPAKLARMSNNALSKFLSRHTLDRAATQIASVIQSVLDGHINAGRNQRQRV